MKKDQNSQHKPEAKADETVEPEIVDINDTEESETAEQVETEAENADLQSQLDEARAALEKEKKEYLFLMAEFDNFRKRSVREKADIIRNASERTLLALLPIVDDFERGLAATADATDAATVREGMELIYNKLIKYLADQGVTPIESNGADFNPDLHDAIATIPAPSPELKGKVVDTTTRGYMINDKVLRHAKVAVGE